MLKFNYAEVPLTISKSLQQGESIQEIDGKQYLCWHDLIDIKVPLFTDPSILHCPRVPLPLWGVNPRSILTKIDEHWWDRTRQKVYESQQEHCHCCGVHKSSQKGYRKYLDAHEYYDINWSTGEVKLKMITALCSCCHNSIHFGRLTAQYESGKIQEKTFREVISHANTLLANSKLPRKNWDITINDNINNLSWDSFYLLLVIDGKEQKFYSLYKNEAELQAAYQ